MEETDATAPQRVLLIGMMGSGKSSIGRKLAERSRWRFVDNDDLVERVTGRTARQLLAEGGEHELRAAESRALRAGLEVAPPVIVGVAAGVILDPGSRAEIDRGGFVVWLRASPEVLARRAAGAEHRPWLDDDAAGWFRRTVAERDALYAEVADIEIDTGRTSPSEAAEMIVAALSAWRVTG